MPIVIHQDFAEQLLKEHPLEKALSILMSELHVRTPRHRILLNALFKRYGLGLFNFDAQAKKADAYYEVYRQDCAVLCRVDPQRLRQFITQVKKQGTATLLDCFHQAYKHRRGYQHDA